MSTRTSKPGEPWYDVLTPVEAREIFELEEAIRNLDEGRRIIAGRREFIKKRASMRVRNKRRRVLAENRDVDKHC